MDEELACYNSLAHYSTDAILQTQITKRINQTVAFVYDYLFKGCKVFTLNQYLLIVYTLEYYSVPTILNMNALFYEQGCIWAKMHVCLQKITADNTQSARFVVNGNSCIYKCIRCLLVEGIGFIVKEVRRPVEDYNPFVLYTALCKELVVTYGHLTVW